MVSCAKLKTDVLGSLMVAVVGLSLLITAILSEFWVQGTAVTVQNEFPGEISVHFGLFSGTKQRQRSASFTRQMAVTCSSSAGVCMFSCGEDQAKDDLEDILGSDPLDNSSGDSVYCGKFDGSWDQETVDSPAVIASEADNSLPADRLLPFGVWVSTLVFLFAGVLCATVCLILTLINVAHNPVSAWIGIDGLIGWNVGAAVSFLISVSIWGAGFAQRMADTLPISDLLRPGVQWSSDGLSHLGFSYWLIFVDIWLHFFVAGLMAYRQYRIYYAPRSRQAKVLEQRVKETATSGGDMLF